MTALELRVFVKTWINQVLPGTLVIKKNENKTRPSLPYIAYEIGAKTPQGREEVSGANITGNITVKKHTDAVVSITGYGDASEELMQTLEFSLALESVKALFVLNKVGNKGVAISVTEIPKLVDQTIERRFLYEPIFGYATEKVENVSYIATVEGIAENSTINPPV